MKGCPATVAFRGPTVEAMAAAAGGVPHCLSIRNLKDPISRDGHHGSVVQGQRLHGQEFLGAVERALLEPVPMALPRGDGECSGLTLEVLVVAISARQITVARRSGSLDRIVRRQPEIGSGKDPRACDPGSS
jgi:hypothetical protein